MDPILVMTDEEARDLKAKGMKAKETGMSSNSLPLTKYRQRMRQLQEQKSDDVANNIDLSQDALEFLNVAAANYLGLVSSPSSSSSSDTSNAAPNLELENKLSSNETDHLEKEPSAGMQSEALELEEFLADVNDVGQVEEVVLISSEEANEILESMIHLDQ